MVEQLGIRTLPAAGMAHSPKCKKPEHWWKECPEPFNIRTATADELAEHQAFVQDMWELRMKEEAMTKTPSETTTNSEDFDNASK